MKRDLLPILDIREVKMDQPVGTAVEDSTDRRSIRLANAGSVIGETFIPTSFVTVTADARFKIKKGDELFARKGTGLIYPIRPRRK